MPIEKGAKRLDIDLQIIASQQYERDGTRAAVLQGFLKKRGKRAVGLVGVSVLATAKCLKRRDFVDIVPDMLFTDIVFKFVDVEHVRIGVREILYHLRQVAAARYIMREEPARVAIRRLGHAEFLRDCIHLRKKATAPAIF